MKFSNVRFIDPTNNNNENIRYNTLGAPTDLNSDENQEWKISASSQYNDNYPPWHVFHLNNYPSFYWHTTSGNTHWIKWQNKLNKIAVTSYSIGQYKHAKEGEVNRYPRAWTFEGSNDDSTWTVLDTQSGQSFTDGVRKTFPVATPGEYYYYRINITSTNNSYLHILSITASTNTIVEKPAETNDGLTPATAWKDIPSFENLLDDTLYIIRRTENDYCILPTLASSTFNSSMTNFAFVGCPFQENDEFFEILTDDQKVALRNSSWLSDSPKYANIKQFGMNAYNMCMSSIKNMYLRRINLERDTILEKIDHASRFIFNISSTFNIIDVRDCRFSGQRVELDKSLYSNKYPPITNGYFNLGTGTNFIFKNNIMNIVDLSCDISDYFTEHAIRIADGRISNVVINYNKFYTTQENVFTNTDSYRMLLSESNSYFRDKPAIYIAYAQSSSDNIGPTQTISMTHNDFIFRPCEYKDIGSIVWIKYFRKLKFTDNNLYSGSPLGSYDFVNTRKCFVHGKQLIRIGNDGLRGQRCDNQYQEAIIKRININLPEVWNVGSAYNYSNNNSNYYCRGCILGIYLNIDTYYYHNNSNNSAPYYARYNTPWSYSTAFCNKKEVSDINIILGEGPDYDTISSSDKTFINNQMNEDLIQGSALYIQGVRKYSDYDQYMAQTYRTDIPPIGFEVKNINVVSPWCLALKCWGIVAKENINLRGGIFIYLSYVDINKLTLKNNQNYIWNNGWNFIRIKELYSDNKTGEDAIIKSNSNGLFIIDKTNISVTGNTSAWATTNAANDAYLCQRSIGESNKFRLRSAFYYIESCSVSRNGNSVLKLTGDPAGEHDKPLWIPGTNGEYLVAKKLVAGKYRITLHGLFTGSDLITDTITTPNESSSHNVYSNLRPILATDNEAIEMIDHEEESNSEWSLTNNMYAFKYTGIIDVRYYQDVCLGIKFSVRSSNYSYDGSGAAVYIDPRFDVSIIKQYEESDSNNV